MSVYDTLLDAEVPPNPSVNKGLSIPDDFWPENLSVAGNVVDLDKVDPGVLAAAKYGALAHDGKVVITSAGRHAGDKGNHSKGYALDVELYGPDGAKYINKASKGGSQHARNYEKFWQDGVALASERYPDLPQRARWGGYFLNSTPADYMHLDVTPGGQAGGGDWVSGANEAMRKRYGGQSEGIIGGDWVAHREQVKLSLNRFGRRIPQAKPESRNVYDDLLEQEQQQRVTGALETASHDQPDKAARIQQLSRASGLDAGTVRDNLDEVSRRQSLADMDIPALVRTNPILARQLEDPNFAALALDDTPTLSGLEQTLRYGANAGRAALSGVYGASEGLLGMAEAGAGAVSQYLTSPLASAHLLPEDSGARVEAGIRELRRTQTAARELFQPKADNVLESGIYSGLQSLTQNLVTLPAALMTGNPMMALAPMAGMTGGQAYGKARDKGLDTGMALSSGMLQSLIEYGTEVAPMGYLLRDLEKGAPFWKILGTQLATDIPGEEVATLTQNMMDWAFLNPDKPAQAFLDEQPSAAAETLIAALVGAGGQVSILKAAEKLTQAGAERAQRAELERQALQQLTDLAKASKTLQRDPESFEKFIEAVTEEGPVNTLYLSADALFQSGVADQLAELSPSVAEQLPNLAAGGIVAIPVSEYATKVAPSEINAALLDNLKTDPEGMSYLEAQDFVKTHSEAMQAEVARAMGEVDKADEFKASQEKVKQEVLSQLNALDRFRPVVNELYATLHSAYAATRAAALGMTPEDFYRKHMLKIQAERVGGEVYGQFAGSRAETADMSAQYTAYLRLDSGDDPEIVRQETGWFVGQDGRWRFEIDDSQAKMKPSIRTLREGDHSPREIAKITYRQRADGTYDISLMPPNPKQVSDFVGLQAVDLETLRVVLPQEAIDKILANEGGDDFIGNLESAKTIDATFDFGGLNALPLSEVLDHPALYAAYPALKQVLVQVDTTLGKGGSFGMTDGGDQIIRLGSGEQLSTLLHEIQHGIQTIEGFATGGSPKNQTLPTNRELAKKINDDYSKKELEIINSSAYKKFIEDFLALMPDKDRYQTGPSGKKIDVGMQWARWGADAQFLQSLKDKRQRDVDEVLVSGDVTSRYTAYSRLYGEVEARNVQARQGFSGAERLAKSPASTQDVSDSDVIVTFNGKDMANAPIPANAGITSALEQTNRGAYSPSENTLTLLKQADLSTFLHESAHYFFENDIAIAGELNQQANIFGLDSLSDGERRILDDVSALLRWHGIQGEIGEQLNTWASLDFDIRRSYHERTAESFERYLIEGKAPSFELQRAFQNFRAWLLNVYKSLKAFLLGHPEAGQLSDEVRQVFDRMIATTDEIQLAEYGRSMLPMFDSPEQAGWTPEEFAAYHAKGIDATNAAIDQLQAQSLRDLQWFDNARARMLSKLKRQSKELRAAARSEATTEVMRQPVYIAWAFLTRKMTDEDFVPNPARKSDPNKVDESRDNLLTAIAKLGGLNKADVVATWGTDPAYKPVSGVFGKPVWRSKGGRSIDDMAEALGQYGYLRLDANGKVDLREFEEKFDNMLRGFDEVSVMHDYSADAKPRPGGDLENPAALGAGRLDYDSLLDFSISAEDVSTLEGRRMTRKSGGLHPDIVAEITYFESGDEMLKALLDAVPPREAINALTDQIMLERNGELATPEAIALAADKAIHNDLRARVIAHELSALERAMKVTQKKNGRSVPLLPQAAKAFAQQMIARLKIRAIQPGQYAHAEARAAKAADRAQKAGDIEQAAAEKRNEIIQHYATKAAYDAREEVDTGLRYLRRFGKESTRKNLTPDYLDQIDALLERYELKAMPLKKIDSRASLKTWLEEQRKAGFEPEIPVDIEEGANRVHYRDLTVEEFRGLVEAVRQIEYLGRLKNRLLTAADKRAYQAIRDEIAKSVLEHAGTRKADTRTASGGLAEWRQLLRQFWASHIKAATWVRVMDGNQYGPLWNYLVRPANDRANWEASMRAEATQELSTILAPVFKLGKMGGKGIYFPSLDRSLNREERIAVALNVGNEGNLQRLLGGEGWTQPQIQPVLESLTATEWRAVQGIWDYFETYRPLIAAKELRVYGKEPNWIEASPFTVKAADGVSVDMRGGYYPIKYDPAASARADEHADAEAAKAQLQGANITSTTRRSFTKTRVESVKDRPLLYSFAGVYQGINEVIHDLAWHEWLIDANRLLKSYTIDKAIRETWGPEVKTELKRWVRDIAEGERGADAPVDRMIGRLRQGVSMAGLGFNVISAAMQPLGLTQSWVRIGPQWIGRGIQKYTAHPIDITRETMAKSEFMANRTRTRFRELNELRNQVQDQSSFKEWMGRNGYRLMMWVQTTVDIPTWQGAYERAISEGEDEARAIAMADQAVKDSQGGGQQLDLSGVERGSGQKGQNPFIKLFTVFYTFMNVGLNVGALQAMTANTPAKKAKLAADFLMLYTVPAVLGYMLKQVLIPSGDDDEEWDMEALARALAAEQLSYLMGLMVLVREFQGVAKIVTGAEGARFGYEGPGGLRFIGDAYKLIEQTAQGEFDDAFRKATLNIIGDVTGLPSAQLNRTITGAYALSEGETEKPSAIVFGFRR